MRFIYQEHSLKSGIYKILNTHSNRIYIGQAKRFKERWPAHRYQLRNGKHQNKFFLSDFGKCKEELGHDDFLEFHVLEVMEGSTRDQRNEREEWWISQVYDENDYCYNFQTKATSWVAPTEEIRAKRVQAMKERWQNTDFRERTGANISKALMGHKMDEKTRQHLSASRKGKPGSRLGTIQSDEAKNKISKSLLGTSRRAKTYEVTLVAPDGHIYRNITNLAKFATEHELHKQDLHKVVIGKRSFCKGWKLAEVA